MEPVAPSSSVSPNEQTTFGCFVVGDRRLSVPPASLFVEIWVQCDVTRPHTFMRIVVMGKYSHEWEKLRKLQRRFLFLVTIGVLIFVLVPPSNRVQKPIGTILQYALIAGWATVCVTLFVSYIQYGYWHCPRCGKWYFTTSGFLWRWFNPFARRCLNCRLPQWDDGP